MAEPQYPALIRTAFVLDEAPVGEVVSKALAAVGVAAKAFVDAPQFLVELQTSPPDLVILDLLLGRSDAVEIIRKLEGLKFKGHVLLVSGRDETTLTEVEQVGRARGLSMLPSLPKPFRLEQFKLRVQSLTAPKSVLRENGKAAQPQTSSPEARTALSQALQQKFLEVWYQPKLDLRTLSNCGAEALVRLRHPQRGLLAPADFLPPVGDPLYTPLTQFVIHRVFSDWQKFAAKGRPLKLAVNVPASILAAPGFVELIRSVLPADPNFPGLSVEVTEDEAFRDMNWMREVATQLHIYNVSMSIDGFGSAFASLSRLKDLPFSEIKLDQSFVTDCATDALKRGLCRSVAELAHCFNASACAEGVDSADDLRCLMTLAFDTAQGFIFAKPMPFGQFLEFIAAPTGGLTSGTPPSVPEPALSVAKA
jgi:EAL domain-containing protein (putative c-di-GMP-specific phosphodiesterase class I)/FixJ family two-component response regulator